ncbi:fumarylacetoacetate hydrolase family protein [Nonomuraea sp. NPDC047897]|jgi:2-keto-4-pentenoate hydratase/2-oxohepta-3-ene-1,7-dioic acid hydratase in catechol pathway|uniref:fumarylacetoacetate hydrolase family protein n=1 Tax=Nonomuraea sp. NPDC047897 TaxID=3364346 RepID=UPI0037221829
MTLEAPVPGALFRLGTALEGDRDTVVVESGGALRRLSDLLPDIPGDATLVELIGSGWETLLDRIAEALAGGAAAPLPDAADVRWRAPVVHPNKLICIGANYKDHIREMGLSLSSLPAYPYSFIVPPATTLVGTGEQVAVPRMAKRIDWEAEVAVIIGCRARDVAPDEAHGCIAAFAVLNDLSARDWSGPNAPSVGIDWVMTKAYDGFKPMAPFLTPARFVGAPDRLRVRSWVNGQPKQDGTTADMVFDFASIVAHLSRIMTLEPGDVIATGTPAGVGHGRKPPEYLVAGDHVAVEVELLGRVETTLVEDLAVVGAAQEISAPGGARR